MITEASTAEVAVGVALSTALMMSSFFDTPLLGHGVLYVAFGYQARQGRAYSDRKEGFQPMLRLLVHAGFPCT
jgi:hypothetical protein